MPTLQHSSARQTLVIAALAFTGMGASFMQTILIPIQGELPQLLNADPADTAWVITITLLVSAICTPISGRLGDMFGKRRVAIVLLILLVLGSILAALSSSLPLLIVARGLQGAGAGTIPLGISILRDILSPKRLATAIALVSATLGVGGALGLPIGAIVTENFDWHILFVVAAIISAVSLALMIFIVPADTLRAGGRIDFAGAIALALGLSGLLLSISKGNEWGWGSALTLGTGIGGIVVLLAWGWYELRARNPLVDLRTTARPPVLLTNLASIAMGFALFSSSIAFPQLLQLPAELGGIGLPLLQASLVLVPSGLAMLVVSPIAGRLSRTLGPKVLLVSGSAIIAVGYLVATLVHLETWHILVINVVIGIGIGLGYAAMPTLIMRAVPSNETAAANGFNTLMRALGTSIAAAVIAVVLTQSATQVGGISVPSLDGFHTAFLLGLGAAVVCTLVAAFIPKLTTAEGEHASLPAGIVDPPE